MRRFDAAAALSLASAYGCVRVWPTSFCPAALLPLMLPQRPPYPVSCLTAHLPHMLPLTFSQAHLASLPATDLVDALASLASCKQAPPSSWLKAATAALMALATEGAGPAARQLPPAYAARCLWALAQLKHRPSEALVDACVAALAGTSTGDELTAVRANSQPLPPLAHDQLPLQHAVSALWALSVLWAQGVSSSSVPAASSQAEAEADSEGASTSDGEAIAAAEAAAWRWRRWQWLQEGLQERLVAGTKKGSAGGVAALDAAHLSRLLAALATPPPPPPSAFEQQQAQSATPQGEWLPALSPALASELGKAAAAKFSSPSSPPAALADAVWAAARLGVSLPPAFAGSAQRRLQSCMAQLPGAQLARMLWSLAAAGLSPTDPQLRAYSQRVREPAGS